MTAGPGPSPASVCGQSDEAPRPGNMKLLLVLISSLLGTQEDASDFDLEPWWNVSRRTSNSDIEYSVPALSLFHYDNGSLNTTWEKEYNANEEILSPFLVHASTKFEESELKSNRNRSPLLKAPDFNNILDAEEIYLNRKPIENIHNVGESEDADVDIRDFEKRLMTRLNQLLGLSMSEKVTGHRGSMSVHGLDLDTYPVDFP